MEGLGAVVWGEAALEEGEEGLLYFPFSLLNMAREAGVLRYLLNMLSTSSAVDTIQLGRCTHTYYYDKTYTCKVTNSQNIYNPIIWTNSTIKG